jgi:ABC-type oligopeptide transport system ATPase subunit
MPDPPLVSVRGLKKYFPLRKGLLAPRDWRKAVDDVSFDIPLGRTLALVGESGSGKSTVGLMLLDLLTPTAGEILYNGRPLVAKGRGNAVIGRHGEPEADPTPSRPRPPTPDTRHPTPYARRERHALRREMQVVFQDPYASLNARMTVREMLTEGMIVHRIGRTAAERERRAAELLGQVGLSPGALDRYPHEFSGGQRQRIAIARALSVGPRFMVLDEPTSALDVSVQSQVLNLLRALQRDHGLTYLFITHNLGVVEYLADAVAVMEAGRIVERGAVEEIFDRPREEYTRRLLRSIPSLDPEHRKLTVVE